MWSQALSIAVPQCSIYGLCGRILSPDLCAQAPDTFTMPQNPTTWAETHLRHRGGLCLKPIPLGVLDPKWKVPGSPPARIPSPDPCREAIFFSKHKQTFLQPLTAQWSDYSPMVQETWVSFSSVMMMTPTHRPYFQSGSNYPGIGFLAGGAGETSSHPPVGVFFSVCKRFINLEKRERTNEKAIRSMIIQTNGLGIYLGKGGLATSPCSKDSLISE